MKYTHAHPSKGSMGMEKILEDKTMKIAICDDEPKRITEVKDALINYFSEKVIATEIFCFEDGNKLLNSNVYFDMALQKL